MNNLESNCEFIKFIKAENEKHLGIAVIRYERRFIFRFKILASEHGGYWATTASIKTGNIQGKDKYEPAFSLDSEYEKSIMNNFVIEHVTKELTAKVATQQSVFNQNQQQQQQQQQNYNQQKNNYQQPAQNNYQPSQTPHMTQQQLNGNAFKGQTSVFDDNNVPF